jgi:LysM repeat protein
MSNSVESREPSPRQRSRSRAVLPWVLGSLVVLGVALAGGLLSAYLVASMRHVPPPQSLITPTPQAQPSPSPSPTSTEVASPSPRVSPSPVAPSPSPTPAVTPLVHTVQRGESISLIAAQYDTTIDAIIELNELQNPNLIVPGQQLLIPPPSEEAEP